MKITFLDDEPELYPHQYGGKARTIMSLAKAFTRMEEVEQVSVVSRSIRHSASEFLHEGIRFRRLESYSTPRQILNEVSSCDVLNVHSCSFTMPYFNGLDAIIVYHLHDVIFATADAGSHLDKALGNNWSAIISPSSFASLTLSNVGWWTSLTERIFTIPRGIDSHIFHPKTKEEGIKYISAQNHQLAEKISTSYPILFFPHRYKANKGEELLPEVYERLAKKYPNLIILATAENSERLPGIENISWLPIADIIYYYSLADVCVVPSKAPEAFSQVPLESIACGTPVVAFKFGNLSKLTEEIPSVKAARPDSDDLAEAVSNLLEEDSITRQIELRRSKSIIEKKYNINKIAEDFIKTYKKLPKNNRVSLPQITSTNEPRYFLSPVVARYDNDIFVPGENGNLNKYTLNSIEREVANHCTTAVPVLTLYQRFNYSPLIKSTIKSLTEKRILTSG